MKNLKCFTLILLVFTGLFTLSCQIGLGAAVDTETPKIEFDSTLPDNAIIRGEFTVKGTWSDDGEIYVNVSLLETVDGVDKTVATWEKVEAPRTKTEAGKNSGTWTCTIDPFEKGKEIHDSANYKIELLIKDKYGHSSSKTKSVTIDNTPPVLVITRPTNAMGESGFDSYGQEFIISGYIGDSCDKRDLKVEIFDAADSETPLYSKIQKDINSTDFSFTVAVKDSEDTELKNAYDTIYGSAEGTKNLYCKISAYDKAMVYGADSDGMGNCAGYYYLYNALYSEVFQNYGVSDIYEMNRNARLADDSVLETLENNKVEFGQFSINPNNNPSFKISGKDPLKMDENNYTENDETYHITNGTAVVAEIEPGLDQTPLYADSLGLYAIEWDDTSKKIKDGAEKIPLLKPLKVLDGSNYVDNPEITEQEKADRKDPNLGLFTNSGTTYKLKTTLKHDINGVQIGKTYIFGIYGYDQKGVAVKNASDIYGFLLSTNSAPTIKIDVPQDFSSYLREGVNLEIEGTATTEFGVPEITIYVNETKHGTVAAANLTSETKGSKVETKYTYTIPASVFSDAKGSDNTEEFEIKAKAEYCGMTAEVQKTVLYDTEAPAIDVTSPADGEWLNATGEVTVSGKISDNLGAVKDVYYSISNRTDKSDASWTKLTYTGVNFSQKLVTTTAEGKATAYIAFYATDKAGNESDILVREINVDTANPSLSGLKYESGESFTAAAVSAASGTSTPLASDTYMIGGSYSDTGTSVSITATRDGEAVTVTQSGTKEGTWQIAEKEVAEGSHEYEIAATDESGKKVTNKITINADKSEPTVALTERPGKEDTKASSYTFSGTSYDGEKGSGVASVTVTITDAADSTKTHTATASGTTNWSLKVEYESDAWKDVFAAEGQKNIVLKATDNAGNVKENAINTFVYDKNDPVLTVTSGATQQYMTSSGFSFAGTASDTYGIGSLKVTEKRYTNQGTDENPNWIEDETARKEQNITVTSNRWSAKVPLGDVNPTDGRYQYQFILADTVDHEAKSTVYTTTVDTTPPTVVIENPVNNNKINANAINEASFRFNGTINEAGSTVWYQILGTSDTAPVAPSTDVLLDASWNGWTKATVGTSTWNFYQTFVSGAENTDDAKGEGHKKLYLYGVDAAGNVSTPLTCLFDVDMSNPALEANITTNESGRGCIVSNGKYYFNENLTGFVKSTDTFGTPVISVAIKTENKPITPVYGTADASGYIPWTISKSEFTNNAEVELEFTATDAMQKTTKSTFTVMRDESAPQISVTSPVNDAFYAGTVGTDGVTVKAEGSITESGIGLVAANFKYKTNINGEWQSFGSYSGGSYWSQDLNIATEGSVTLYLTAVDRLENGSRNAQGNLIPQTQVTFSYDKTVPTLTLDTATTALGTTDATTYFGTGKTITLKGTAYDTNKLREVRITDTVNGNTTTYTTTNSGDGFTVTGSIADAKSSDTAITWSKTFSADSMAEGNHVITITAIDDATTAGRTTSITKNIWIDTTPSVIKTIETPSVFETESTSYRFIGTVEDSITSPTDVKIKFASVKDDGSLPNGITLDSLPEYSVSGTASWNYPLTFSNNGIFTDTNGNPISGKKKIFVKVTDRAGNVSPYTTAGNSAVFVYDKQAPSVGLTSYAYKETDSYGASHNTTADFSSGSVFKMSGEIFDDWDFAASDVTVTQKRGDKQITIPSSAINFTSPASAPAYGTKKIWTIEGLPRDETTAAKTQETLTTGVYTYTISVKDKAGKENSKEIKVTVDSNPPKVNITSITAAYISGTSYNFTGSATDTDTNADVGLASYSYIFSKESTAPSTGWKTVTANDGSWAINANLQEGINNTYASDEKLCEGKWYLYVYATDKAGNKSATKSINFTVDIKDPEFTDADTKITTGASTIASGGTYFFKGALAGTVAAKDTYSLAATPITVTVDGTSVYTGGNGNWTVAADKFTEGKYQTLAITAADSVGRTVTKSFNVYKDTTAPDVLITSPSENSQHDTNTISATFSVTEAGVGIQGKDESTSPSTPSKIEYSLDGTNWTATDYVSGARYTQEGIDLGSTQGQKTLYIRATDKLGNAATPASVKFYYDLHDPVISENDTIGSYVNASATTFTLSGTAYDTYKLKYIELKDGINIYKSNDATPGVTITDKQNGSDITKGISENTAITWSKTFTTENLTQGAHTFRIAAYDDSGKKSTELTKSIFIDTKAPTVESVVLPDTSITQTANHRFIVTAKDTADATANSGVNKVEIQIVNKGTTLKTTADDDSTAWIELLASSDNYSYPVVFADYTVFNTESVKDLYVRVTDNAGNVTRTQSPYQFAYDKSAPTVSITKYNGGTEKDISSLNYVKGGFTLSGTASDGYGIKEIVIKQNGTTIETITCTAGTKSKDWTVLNLPRDPTNPTNQLSTINSANYDYEVTVVDRSNEDITITGKTNKSSSTTQKIIVDVDSPTVNFTNPSANLGTTSYISADSYTIRGNANDNAGGIGLAGYSYAFTQSATVPSTGWETVTAENGDWTISVNLQEGTTNSYATDKKLCEGQWFLHVKATDKAGNESTDKYISFYVDKNDPEFSSSAPATIATGTGTNTILSGGTYYFKGALNGSATVTDTYRLATNPITVSVDKNVVYTGANGNWTVAADKFTESKYQTVTVTGTDFCGRKVTESFNVYKDTTAPEIEITAPGANSQQDSQTISATFSVNENGVGIQGKDESTSPSTPSKIEYSLDGTNWTATDYVSGARYTQAGIDLGTTQGQKTLYIRATDKLGNAAPTPASVQFYYDYENPVILETDTTGAYVNKSVESFTLSGTVYDTYKLDRVEIKDGSTLLTGLTITDKDSGNDITKGISEDTAVTWSKTFTTSEMTEGNHNFKITAYDVSGRASDVITKSVFIDTKAPTVGAQITVPADESDTTTQFPFTGTAADSVSGGQKDSGLAQVEIQVVNKDGTVSDDKWYQVIGTYNWNYTLLFSNDDVFSTEGEKTLYVRAKDMAGNYSVYSTKDFTYDEASPALSVTSFTSDGGSPIALAQGETSFNVKGNFALSGSASDGYGIEKIVVTQKIGNGAVQTIATLTDSDITDGNWTISDLPRKTTALDTKLPYDEITSGTYTYTVEVTDKAGKTTPKISTAVIDKTKPTINITTPRNDSANTGLSAVNVVSFRFAGNSSDGNDASATGIENVWYRIVPQDADAGSYIAPTSNTTLDSSWTTPAYGFTKATNTESWFFSQGFQNGTDSTTDDVTHEIIYGEGKYKLVVYAVDKAGNVSDVKTTNFDVDMAYPDMETQIDDELVENSSTQTKTGSYTFKFKLTETYGLIENNPVVTMKKDGAAFTSFTTEIEKDTDGITPTGYTLITIENQRDGSYEYSISAEDLVGKKTEISRTVLLDTTPPAITITSPADFDAYISSRTLSITGSSDDASGTYGVYYKYDPDTAPVTVPVLGANVSEWNSAWTNAGWKTATGTSSWKIDLTESDVTENVNNHTLYIAAVDTNGRISDFVAGTNKYSDSGDKVTNVVRRTLKVDQNTPVITETSVTAAGLKTNGKKNNADKKFVLSGSASDTTYDIKSLTLTYKKDGSATDESFGSWTADGGDSNTITYSTSTKEWSREVKIDKETPGNSDLADGSYEFTIAVEDIAGTKQSVTRTVVVDTSNPTFSTNTSGQTDRNGITTITTTKVDEKNWYNTNSITVLATAAGNGTNIASLEVRVNGGEYSIFTTSSTAATGVNCSQGPNTIDIRATDEAGNTAVKTYANVYIDTIKPNNCDLYSVDGDTEFDGNRDQKLVNGRNGVEVVVANVSDDENGSGVKSVKCTGIGSTTFSDSDKISATKSTITIDETTGETKVVWTFTIPAEKIQAGSVKVEVEDNVGLKTETILFTFKVDQTAPTVSIVTPNDADKSESAAGIQVNGTISLEGSSRDIGGADLEKVELWYNTADNNTGWTKLVSYEENAASSWTKSVITSSAFGTLTEPATIYVVAVASDTAGNRNLDTVENGVVTDNTDENLKPKLTPSEIKAKISKAENGNAVTDGSKGYLEIVVNQDTDRPVVRLTSIAGDGSTTLTSKRVTGTLTDDDGNVNKMWYAPVVDSNARAIPTVPTAPSYSEGDWTVPSAWIEVDELTNNSFAINAKKNATSSADDGDIHWYLAVADANNRVFTSGDGTNSTAKLSRTKVIFSDNTVVSNDAAIEFKFDTTPPRINSFKILKAKTADLIASDFADEETAEGGNTIKKAPKAENIQKYIDSVSDLDWTNVKNTAFGGDYGTLYVQVVVQEATAMNATPLSLLFKTDSLDLTGKLSEEVDDETGSVHTYVLGPFDMTENSDSGDLKVTAYDAVNNDRDESLSIIKDNEGPTNITNVKPTSAEETNGTFTYSGLMADNYAGVNNIQYYIPKYSEANPDSGDINPAGITDWRDVTNKSSVNWTIEFSGENNLAGARYLDYRVGNSGTITYSPDYKNYDSNNDDVFEVPVWFKLKDNVGNEEYVTENIIKYNPNTDRPSVRITSPEHNQLHEVTNSGSSETVDYVIMGGVARISGIAEDDEGIDAVYLQFDLNGDGIWDNGVANLSDDLATKPTADTPKISNCPWDLSDVVKIGESNNYGIRVTGTKNWSYSVNLTDLSSPTITEVKNASGEVTGHTGKTLNVRAITIDNDTENGQLISAWSNVVKISVNNNVPRFTDLKIKQIVNNEEKVVKEYQSGMFLTGENWYLTGNVFASGGISSSSYDGTKRSTNANSCFTNTSGFNYYMQIAIEPENGIWDEDITVSDNKQSGINSSSQKIEINVDNTPPAFFETYTTSSEVNTFGTVKHYVNAYGNRGILLTPSAPIQNSNGTTTIYGRVKDDGSGFEKAIFYFKRVGSSETRIYNVMEESGSNGTANKVVINTSLRQKTPGKVYIDASATGDNLPNLYVKTDTTANMTVERPSDVEIQVKPTTGEAFASGYAGIKDNKNIRVGGLIKIGGVYRTITDVTDDTVTFDSSCAESFTEAEFVYGMVVDSTGETQMSDGTINESDGDGMLESFTEAAGVATWNASINSSNIPDGPVELHVVVFDQAGNIGHGYTKTKVSNNPPRITKVMLGTDLNGNGKYDVNTEFETFYAVKNNYGTDVSTGKEIWNLDTKTEMGGNSYYTVKNGLALIPEFVGGTGNIYYKFKKTTLTPAEVTAVENDTDTVKRPVFASKGLKQAENLEANDSNLLKTQTAINGTVNAEVNKNKIGQLILSNDNIVSTTGENSQNIYSFSFWDSTEELTPGTETGSTVLNVLVTQDLVDGDAPKVVVDRFHWYGKGNETTSTTDIYREYQYGDVKANKDINGDLYTRTGTEGAYIYTRVSSANTVTNDKATVYRKITVPINHLYKPEYGNVNGHIELESDLNFDGSSFSSTGTGVNDLDPKVSGKITFTGTTYDNVRIGSISFRLADKNGNNVFTPAGSTNETKIVESKTFYVGAKYSNGQWTSKKSTVIGGTATDNWQFEVENDYFNQNGHKANWKLSIDTSMINGVAATDLTLYVYAEDAATTANKSSLNASTDKRDNDATPAVQVLDISDGVYNLPVYKVDVVPYVTEISTSLDEMSEGTGSVYSRTAKGHYSVYDKEQITINGFNLKGATAKIGDENLTINSTDTAKIVATLPDAAKSGALKVIVSTIESLNNINDDAAKGAYSGNDVNQMYNRQPNGINNDTLTDDLELDIWEFKTAANPRDGEILTPEMQIGPNGEVGFAFVNGNFYFNMAGPSKVGDTATYASQRSYEGDYAPYYESALVFNKVGNTFGISTNQDSNNNYSAYTAFYFGQRATDDYGVKGWNAKSEGNYQGGAYRRRLQSTTSSLTTGSIQDTSVYRAMSPSIVACGDDNYTNVYTAFYDAVRKEVRYKWGVVSNGTADTLNQRFSTYAISSIDNNNDVEYPHFSAGNTAGLFNYAIKADVDYPNNPKANNNRDKVHVYDVYGNKLTIGGTQDFSVIANWTSYFTEINTWAGITPYNKPTKDPLNIIGTDAAYIIRDGKESDVYFENHGLKVGSAISFVKRTDSFMQNTLNTYYVVGVPDANHIQLSETQGGNALKLWEINYERPNTIPLNTSGNVTGLYVTKVGGQLIDATGGYNGGHVSPAASTTEDKSIDASLYSVVASTNCTKTTAATAIGVVPRGTNGSTDDVVCIAWYDGSARALKYAYTTTPRTDDGITSDMFTTKTIQSGAGYNVKMKVDTDGGIHMAYFTTAGAKLRYAYAPDYQSDFTVVEVDNYSLTTNDIGLDVAKDASGNLVPYISYLSGNQLAKVAYPVAWDNGLATKDGISNSKYTGDWELAVVPSEGYSTTNAYSSKTSARNTELDNLQPKFDTICVGVHKNWNTGTIAVIPTYDTKINISNDDTDSNYSTRIGGNGTSNPALAYTVVGDDSLQFAQMK